MTKVTEANFEQRLQSIIQSAILLLVSWVGYSTVDLGKSTARLEVKYEQAARDIGDLKTELSAMRTQTTTVATALAATTAAVATSANNTAAAAAAAAAAAVDSRKK